MVLSVSGVLGNYREKPSFLLGAVTEVTSNDGCSYDELNSYTDKTDTDTVVRVQHKNMSEKPSGGLWSNRLESETGVIKNHQCSNRR